MSIASIAMYVTPAPLAEATEALWSFIRAGLSEAGLGGIPGELARDIAYDDAWLRPDLLLSQTCGYPYVTRLRGSVRLVATPVYNHPGCSGPLMRSFIIARCDSPIECLEDLRGRIAAINSPDSNSGANLFRAALAPLAAGQSVFAGIVQTGSHGASIDAVSSGLADCASIDCVTFGNIRRFDPARLEAMRVVAETPSGPGLPFITAGTASDALVATLRGVLNSAITDTSLGSVRDAMGLSGFEVLADTDYEPLAEFARQAKKLGFPDF